MENIDKAREMLEPIKYEPFEYGYFVLQNGRDMGESDYCENCIGKAVKEARKYHKEQREKLIEKYNLIATKGYCFHNGKKVKVAGKYTKEQIAKSKRRELKEYPSKAAFTYEGHDTDFGGGLQEPCSCADCGEYFVCNFQPNKETAQRLLDYVNEPLTDRDKWEIDIALSNYNYVGDDVKLLLDKIVEKIHSLHTGALAKIIF